ncbi:MAG: hypothetical protein RR576_01345 [Oscillospiraceae bacterium]
MNRFKKWLTDKYLPTYVRLSMLAENERLKSENARMESEMALLKSYIRGIERALRAQRAEITVQGDSTNGSN